MLRRLMVRQVNLFKSIAFFILLAGCASTLPCDCNLECEVRESERLASESYVADPECRPSDLFPPPKEVKRHKNFLPSKKGHRP